MADAIQIDLTDDMNKGWLHPTGKPIKKFAKNSIESYVEHVHSHNHLEDEDYTNSTLETAKNALEPETRDRVILQESNLYAAAQQLEGEMLMEYLNAVKNGQFDEADDIINASEEKRFRSELELTLSGFFLLLYPIYAQQLMAERASEFQKQGIFAMTDELEKEIKNQAKKAAESHVNTVQKDLEKAVAFAVHEETEKALVELVRQGAEARNAGILKLLPENPNLEDITAAVKAGKFNDNPIYKRARDLAREGNGLDSITRSLKKEYQQISRNRARTIARHETNRVFNMAQYQADLQFLKESGLMENAYKILRNRADDPCPFCQKLIDESKSDPIPFQKNFISLGDSLTATFTGTSGNKSVRTLPINYESISAGNIHVNCRCEYVLLIKQDDGSFLNNIDTRVFNKAGNPNHDKAGKFSFGTTAQKATLADVESKIRSNKTETFHGVATNGDIVATLKGNSKQVKVDFPTAMKLAASKNIILTHNHPAQGKINKTFPFSVDDIKTASMTNARGIRAIGTTHDYAMSRKGDTWPAPSQITKQYNLGKTEAEKTLRPKVDSGGLKNEEAQFEYYHLTMKSIATKFDLAYERREVK